MQRVSQLESQMKPINLAACHKAIVHGSHISTIPGPGLHFLHGATCPPILAGQLAHMSNLMSALHIAGASLQSAGGCAGCEAKPSTGLSGACGHPDAADHSLYLIALILCSSRHPASIAGCPLMGCSSFAHGNQLSACIAKNFPLQASFARPAMGSKS